MKIDSNLIRRVEDKLLDTYLLAQKQFGRNFILPKLSFELNSNRIAGQANSELNLIRINPKFLTEFSETVIDNTVGHEAAHLIADTLYPNASRHHGAEWKSVAVKLDVRPVRCHSMVLEEKIKKSFEYKCLECEQSFYLSPIKHKRCQWGSNYLCVTCGERIVFAG